MTQPDEVEIGRFYRSNVGIVALVVDTQHEGTVQVDVAGYIETIDKETFCKQFTPILVKEMRD